MNCSKCQRENRSGRRFCAECGAPLSVHCPACQAPNEAGEKFCGECGASLTQIRNSNFEVRNAEGALDARYSTRDTRHPTPAKHLADKILTSRSALEGERKQVTVLFADVKGSMELAEEMDPEEWARIMRGFFQILSEGVERFEGFVDKFTGDGIMALFGAPIAHEDHARRACYAALGLTEQLRQYADQLRRDRGLNFSVRMGLHSGEVVVGTIGDDLRMDYTAQGHTVGLAQRMEQLAEAGKVYLTGDTARLVEGFFRLADLGQFAVKGVHGRLGVYELQGVGPLRTRIDVAARRGLVRFVGRQDEMHQLHRAWETAQTGKGQIVAVMGEAGVGKSRLFHEFKAPLQSGCLVLAAFSVSHGKAQAYMPLVDLLKTYFQIGLDDDERRRREKITGKLLTLDRALEDTLPYLFSLLGVAGQDSPLREMDPQIRRQRTQDAVKRLLLRESLDQPLLAIFEDLHWIDGETQAFLDALADSAATARMLLLVNYRPEYTHGWASKTHYARLRLDPLGRKEAEELLQALLGDTAGESLDPVKQLVMERTDGNPFFMEELVQTLAEEEVLGGERGGYRLQKPLGDVHVPASVQAILAARIDRLPAEVKDLLQTLAVIGAEFPLGLIRRVVGRSDVPPFEKGGAGGISSDLQQIPVNPPLLQGEEELLAALHRLQTAEFVYEQPAFPEPEYTFKHALTQEVAYQSLLTDRRKGLHERTARAIEELYRYKLDDHYGELAHHYGRSENTAKAAQYLQLAAELAVERSAYDEALRQIEKGLELVQKLPQGPERDRQELLLHVPLGPTLRAKKGFTAPELEPSLLRARDLCEHLEDLELIPEIYGGLWLFYMIGADLVRAQEHAERCLEVATEAGDPWALGWAHHTLGATYYWRGELRRSLEHFEQSFDFDNPRKYGLETLPGFKFEVLIANRGFQASVRGVLGYLDQAEAASLESLALARERGRPFPLALAYMFHLTRLLWERDAQGIKKQAEALIALAEEHGFLTHLGIGNMYRAWAIASLGEVDEGIGQLRLILEGLRSAGVRMGWPYWNSMLAELCVNHGRAEEALQTIASGIEVMNATGQLVSEPNLCQARGEALLALSSANRDEAEACFLRAIESARRQEYKFMELTAATCLSRLWRDQGKKEGAHRMLAEVYGWFTEGFEKRSLREARTLLEELA